MSLTYKTLSEGLSDSFKKNADRLALSTHEGEFTYHRIANESYHLAKLIQKNSTSTYVPVFGYRSRTVYQAIFAVLLCGKAYSPLNPKFPPQRTGNMLDRISSDCLILSSECVEAFNNVAAEVDPLTVICCGTKEDFSSLQQNNTQHRYIFSKETEVDGSFEPVFPREEDPAYLLFTSGSTGVPKGVSVSNRNVMAYLKTTIKHYGIKPVDRLSQMFDLTFDLSVHDIFVSVLSGASLYVVPEKNLFAPSRFIRDSELTVWFSVPSVVMFMNKLRMLKPDIFPSLRISLFCGEALPVSSAESWQVAAPDSVVDNLYGPTEATIAITRYTWKPEQTPGKSHNGIVPIGTVFEGQQVVIVDEQKKIVKTGGSGELLLSGTQVTSAYHRAPDITEKKYIQLPETGNQIWYRTGDLAELDEEGCLYYLGRIDDQVQVLGHRVELQEIDRVLRDASGTELAIAVPVRGDSGTVDKIEAFVQMKESVEMRKEILKACRNNLPDYMIPSQIYFMKTFPLNVNGKIDRNKIKGK